MILNYVLVVTGPIYGKQSSLSAYRFAKALMEKNHRLERVFFYQEGVSNASSLTLPASDEFDLAAAWKKLSQERGIALEICVAAALRRGLVNAAEAKQHGLLGFNMSGNFDLVGLGGLSESLINADRIVQF